MDRFGGQNRSPPTLAETYAMSTKQQRPSQQRPSPFGNPDELTDAQRLQLREYAEGTWNGASIGGAAGTLPTAMCYYWC